MRDFSTVDKIRDILGEHAGLELDIRMLANDSDLYEAGMSSSASVSVLFALEREFGILFPEHMLERNMFGNISSIHAAVSRLLDAQPRHVLPAGLGVICALTWQFAAFTEKSAGMLDLLVIA